MTTGSFRGFRHRAVAAIAGMVMSKKSAPRHAGACKYLDLFGSKLRRIVQPVDLVAGKALEQIVGEHRARPAETFLGRLENENRGCHRSCGFREIARSAEQNGGVAVMAAAVKAARNGGAPRQVGLLFHWQRVHVGAKPDPAAAAALALQQADDTGAANVAMHLDAPFARASRRRCPMSGVPRSRFRDAHAGRGEWR